MPTLQELIAAHEARQPDPIVLTPKGAAVVLARRLGRAVAELDDPLDRLTVQKRPAGVPPPAAPCPGVARPGRGRIAQMTDTTITRRRAIGAGAIAAGLMSAAGARPPRVAAEPIAPADELGALLGRAADLLRGPLRWDDETRVSFWGQIDELQSLCIALDPQDPPAA